MAMALNEYEEARRKTLEENRKRMDELGLLDMIEDLNPSSSKSPTRKPVKQKMPSSQDHRLPSRRSARTADKPPVDYKLAIPIDRYIGATAADFSVMEAVETALTKVTNPAFVRPVLYSYGAGSYHGYIPLEFRTSYMPEIDEWFTLEDEDRMEWRIMFSTEYGDLRKGWRDFSLHHELMAGDICLFELVSPLRLRVQIFRIGGSHKKSNGKKVAGKGPQNWKMSGKRKCTVPEDGHVIDSKPKLEVKSVEDYQSANRLEAQLSISIDRKPKLEGEPPRDNLIGACRDARLSFPIDRKPKLEANPLVDCQSTDPREARHSSPNPARTQILKGTTWTLENPD